MPRTRNTAEYGRPTKLFTKAIGQEAMNDQVRRREIVSAQRRLTSPESKPKLLVVPHVCARDISIREVEFARRLAGQFEVHCLWWDDALHVDGQPSLARRWKQFRKAASSAVTPFRIEHSGDIAYVHAPVLQPLLLQRLIGRRLAVHHARRFNGRQLLRIVTAQRITHLLIAASIFDLRHITGPSTFFDVVDWVPEENLPPEEVEALRLYLRDAAARVQGFFAVSEPLCDKLRDECGVEAVPLPNGADLCALRTTPAERVSNLREELGLQGRYVVGYIGNHGSYTGVDFVVSVFEKLRQRMSDAALLIVGPAECWRSILEGRRKQNIVWTGPVPPAEVGAYFHAIDIGVLAQEKTLGTELAFQLKNVEYTACRKFVVSTPLRTWQRLRWPNILLTDLRVDDWVSAICGAREREWSPVWDSLTDAYDWTNLAARMANIMLEGGVRRSQRACAP